MDPLFLQGGNDNGEEPKRWLTGEPLGQFHDPNLSRGEVIVKRHAEIMHEVQGLILLETQETPEHPLWQRTKVPFWCSGAALVAMPTFTN
jgi:hypothetical protein